MLLLPLIGDLHMAVLANGTYSSLLHVYQLVNIVVLPSVLFRRRTHSKRDGNLNKR